MSARDALLKYSRSQLNFGKNKREKRKNKTPEKDLEREVMKWLNQNDFSCHVVESKANYSASANRYLRGSTVPGMPDIIGCDPLGFGVFVELKAPGRRSTLRSAQKDFLLTKIKLGCFAVVCDSVYSLADCYGKWRILPRADRIKYLENLMPKKRRDQKSSPKDLF